MFIKKARNLRYTPQGSDNVYRLKLLIFCLMVAVNAALPSACLAETYYLDAVSGNDSNPGTSNEPWKTIGKAFNAATYGDTVMLRNGNYGDVYNPISFPVYTGSMTEPLPPSTEFITFKADIGCEPVFTRVYLGGTANNYYTPYIFDGIRVESDTTIGVGLYCTVGPRFKNCEIIGITSFEGYGFYLGKGTGNLGNNDVRIEDCIIRNWMRGILTYASNIALIGNDIYDIGEDHIYILAGGANGYNTLIENNKIHTNKRAYVGEHPDGIALNDLTNVIIRNNTLYNLSTQGIFVHGVGWTKNVLIENNLLYNIGATEIQFGTADNVTIRNNTIVGHENYGVVNIRGGVNHEVYNNIFISNYWGNESYLSYHDYNIYAKGGNSIGDNEPHSYGYSSKAAALAALPELFVNPANRDYRLKVGSRAIDFGDPAHAPGVDVNHPNGVDITHKDRDNIPDAGCYEYISGPPDTTTPSAPQNLTATPASESQINLSWDASSDPESGVSYYNIYRDGALINTSSTLSFSDTGLNSGTTYTYQVSAVNGAGLESRTSNLAEAETYSDTTPPTIISVTVQSPVHILFSEPLDEATATNISNYSISTGITIYSATLEEDLRTVVLSTSDHVENVEYVLTVNAVKDVAGNPIVGATYTYQYSSGLIGYWELDDGSGTSAADSSGNNNTGALISGSTWTSGILNGAVQFDGIDDAVEIGTTGWNVNSGTVSLYAYPYNSGGSQYLFGHNVGTSSWSNRIQLYTSDGALGLGLGDSHTVETAIQNLSPQTWHHIALTWDGTNYAVYINGIEDANGSYAGLTALNTLADIGNTGNTSYRNQETFNGIIDEVRLYNHALTADEVLERYNETAPLLLFGPIGNKTINEGSTLVFDVNVLEPNIVVDINDHNLPSDPCFFYNGGVWTFSWTPTYDDAGSYEVTFEARHDEYVDFETITITVINVNRLPVANNDASTTNEDTAVTINVLANDTDLDGDPLTVDSITQASNGSAVLNIDDTVTYTPASNVNGTDSFTYTISDGQGGADSATVTITVNAVPDPPTLAPIGDKSVSENSLLSFLISATDPDDDLITYSCPNLPSGAVLSGETFAWTPTSGQAGVYEVTFVASDGQQQDSETITITVINVNRQPLFTPAIGDKSVFEGNELRFTISAIDPDGDPIMYSAPNLPTRAVFSGDTFTWTPGYKQSGWYQVTFVASDGQDQDSETITITVKNQNGPPTIAEIGDKSVSENSLLSFLISATDPDDDLITYSCPNLPSGAVLTGETFAWTPTSGQAGVYEVTFVASDGQLQDSQTITISVVDFDTSAPALVGSWLFDDDPANGALDSSQYGNDGYASLNAYPSLVSGKVGRAYSFDAVDDRVKVPHSPSLNVNKVTLSAWIYVNSYKNDQRIISKETGVKRRDSVYALLLSGKRNKKLQFRLALKGVRKGKKLTSNSTIPLNEWTHVAAAYNGKYVRLYINGALDKKAQRSETVRPLRHNRKPVYIGDSQFYNRHFDGKIDDIRIYNWALGTVGVRQLCRQSN